MKKDKMKFLLYFKVDNKMFDSINCVKTA